MAKSKNNGSLLGYILFGLVAVSFILVIVAMFVGQVTVTAKSTLAGGSTSNTIALFDENWGVKEVLGKEVGISNTFAIISYIVTIVGALALVADGVLRVFLKKEIKILTLVAAIVTLVGAILILSSGLSMVGEMNKGSVDMGDLFKGDAAAGAGVWLGFIFGLIAAIAGALPLVMKTGNR